MSERVFISRIAVFLRSLMLVQLHECMLILPLFSVIHVNANADHVAGLPATHSYNE